MKEVNNQTYLSFELGSQESMNVPKWIIIGFQQRNKQDSQSLNNDIFCRLPVTSAQCIIGTKKYPDAGIMFKYDDDGVTQGYSHFKEAFRALAEDDILKPCILDHDFKTSNGRFDEVGYNLYVFDIRYQQNFTASQPIKVDFKFDVIVPYDVSGYAWLLTNNLISISSDGQRHFDLI